VQKSRWHRTPTNNSLKLSAVRTGRLGQFFLYTDADIRGIDSATLDEYANTAWFFRVSSVIGTCKTLDQIGGSIHLIRLPAADDLRETRKTKLVCVLIQWWRCRCPYIRVRCTGKNCQDDRSEPLDSFSDVCRRPMHRSFCTSEAIQDLLARLFFFALQLGPKHARAAELRSSSAC